LELVKGAPALRRNYLDSILIRLDKTYSHELNRYERTLKQRNALLKRINEGLSRKDELEIWDAELEKHALILWEKRTVLIKEIQSFFETKYRKISKKEDKVYLEYMPKKDTEDFSADLRRRWEKDIVIGSTTVGPHRDDFIVYLNDKEASEYASQGETRSLVLSLKFSEIKILEAKHNTNVTLLMDDVFSELDHIRQQALLDLSLSRQTFITTTHIDEYIKISEENLYRIKSGKLITER